MMINILSIQCGLPFAPYLTASLAEFLCDGAITSRVVRQGGRGLILRSDGDLVLRHEHRQATLGMEEARHYAATVQFRREFYDVSRMQDEVVLANVGSEIVLSHPQSEMWLSRETVSALANIFRDASAEAQATAVSFPEWLKVSIGGGRMLLSDQRTARWVLLGEDHVRELDRRLSQPRLAGASVTVPAPPTIPLKGLTVHLQSAFKLVATLLDFALSQHVTPFEEITPTYALRAWGTTERLELMDSDQRVVLTPREARKWANLIQTELERLNARQVERGGIRTVFADQRDDRWILQWGDEILVPEGVLSRSASSGAALNDTASYPVVKRIEEFLLVLNPATGACVALTDSESEHRDDDLLR